MEQIIRSQQEQIAGLLETNRSLVESNGKLLEQTDALQRKIQELLSQIAWLNRQLFGRRSEKLAALDPNQLSLFDSVPATGQDEDIREDDSSAAVPSKTKPDGKKKESRRNRELLEGLPVVEVVIEPDRVDLDRYRQVKEFRHLGIRLSESTLSGWFKPVCELLRPLYDELVRLVVGCGYVQADETTIRVISKGKGKADKEYLWMVRAVMEKLVIFHYDDGSRSGQTIRKLLKDFKGYLQSDGYSAYNVFEGTEGVCLIACLAHIRRHFETALEENRSLAEHALKTIQEIYRIEHFADSREYTAEERRELRLCQSVPLLDSFEKWMEGTYVKVPPKSRMGQAISYAYPLWPRMKAFLKDGNIKIDNNLAENAIRPLTLSRKNFLFCGNHEAAENTAVICSLLATCKAQEVNPREWLNDVIARLPYYQEKDSGKDIRELLPDVWKLKKSNENPIEV